MADHDQDHTWPLVGQKCQKNTNIKWLKILGNVILTTYNVLSHKGPGQVVKKKKKYVLSHKIYFVNKNSSRKR